MQSFFHEFYDIEIETTHTDPEVHLIKILAVDGRRFTYELRGHLNEDAVDYIKTVIDAAVFGDMIIECGPEGFEIRDSPVRLKRHS